MTGPRLIPINGKILVRPIAPPTETASGLVLVRGYQPDVMGEVLAIPHDDTCEVEVGDVVVFSPTAGSELVVEGERLLTMQATEVLAVVEQEQTA